MFPGMPDMKPSTEELKSKILNQAQSILMVKFNSEMQKIQMMVGQKEITTMDAKANWPKPPTTEDIIKEAHKLYKYLSKNNGK